MKNDSQLGYALLGLIHQQAMSGYGLRKMFTSTAMGSFSDSPGAIYPALARLEAGGLTRGTVQQSSGLRQRRIFHITPRGLAAFKVWLKQPVTRDDVIRRSAELMLRFAFLDGTLGAETTLRFLSEFAEELQGYVKELQKYLQSHASEMPLSGRLALECGIEEYAVRLRWARSSAVLYEERKRNQV
jgi:DNA-binding PadR family transcriptional regulator